MTVRLSRMNALSGYRFAWWCMELWYAKQVRQTRTSDMMEHYVRCTSATSSKIEQELP